MDHCPVCTSGALSPLFHADRVPVFCNVQWPDRAAAYAAPRARLDIVVCHDCGHACNAAFDPRLVEYSPAYDNSQHFSATFRDYAVRLVDRLVDAYGIRQAAVVDIGCGRGDLLALLAERGDNRGFGFDPSFDPASAVAGPRVAISREYFARHHAAEIGPALVCCRHVLEHVPDPIQFLAGLRDSIAAAGAPVLYLEVPSGDHLLRSAGIWDYIYEHFSYFSQDSLRIALESAGYETLRIYEEFGGQFLCAEARPADRSRAAPAGKARSGDGIDLALATSRMQTKLAGWRNWAERLSATRQPATIWGAGSKGVMFLNLLGLAAPFPVEFAIDQNPNKSHRFLAVTGQVVMSPAHLEDTPVEEVIVMNEIYFDEIKKRLADSGSRVRIAVA